jgi:hypothetical protein
MVCVSVRNDQRAQLSDRNLQDIQVAPESGRRQTPVVENRTPATVRLDRDQRRKAMLRNQLAAITPIGGDVPADIVGAGHQHVDEVVDDDRDFGTINRLEPNRPTDSHRRLTLQSSRRSRAN